MRLSLNQQITVVDPLFTYGKRYAGYSKYLTIINLKSLHTYYGFYYFFIFTALVMSKELLILVCQKSPATIAKKRPDKLWFRSAESLP